MSEPRVFVIYTSDQQRHAVEAPTLRTALRNFGGSPAAIVGAFDLTCLPLPNEERPFLAVFLANPHFKKPPLDEG